MNTESRKLLELESYYGAVAIIQSSIPNLFYYADVASKEADVITIEITGNCPQSLSNMSIWGNIEAVQSAMNAVIKHYNDKKEKYGLST